MDLSESCERLCATECTQSELMLIKNKFRHDIKSERLIGKIDSLRYLIRVLIRRDIINDQDFNGLKYIADVLQRSIVFSGRNGMYNSEFEFVHLETSRSDYPHVCNVQVLPQISRNVETRVFDLICLQIGNRWKDLARELQIAEGYIDDLERQYRNRSDAVREILNHHRNSSDSRYWELNLYQALERARRKDLSEEIQKILAMHR